MKESQTNPWFARDRSKLAPPLAVFFFFFFFFFSHFLLAFFFFGRARRVFTQTLPALGGAAGACVFGTVYPAHENNGGAAATVARTNVRAQRRRSRRTRRQQIVFLGTDVC
jgi:hypothetical protein